MSRAFVKEVEYEINDLPDRPVTQRVTNQSFVGTQSAGTQYVTMRSGNER